MKIHSNPTQVIQLAPSFGIPGNPPIPRKGSILCSILSVPLLSFATTLTAHAAKVDGSYEVTSVTGSITFDGDKVDIPKSIVERIAGVVHGDITIQNETLELKKKAAIRFAEKLADELDLDIDASVTGPSSVTLEKSGRVFTGRTDGPIVTSFDADAFGVDFSGQLKTRVSARVSGRTLTMVVRFGGSGAGSEVSGRVTIVANR